MERLRKIGVDTLKLMLVTGIVVFNYSTSSMAEEQYEFTFDQVVVTSSKVPQTEKDVTQKMDIIDYDEINRTALYNKNISEIMYYTPGFAVNVLSRNDANWGSYGGVGPKYSTFLLDGLPIDSFADSMSLDPWAFERVEVQRGPASIMYSNYLTQDFAGNETPLAGVSNFIMREKVDEFRTRLLAGYGSWNTFDASLYNQGYFGNFNYFIGGSYQRSDYTNYGTKDSWLNMLDSPQYQKTKLYFKGTYFLGREDQKISLFAHHTQHTGDAGRPNRDYDHQYDTVNAIYSNQFNEWLNVQLKAGYRYYNRTWGEDNFPTNLALRERDGVKQNIVPADLTFSIIPFKNSLLTVGTDYQYATYETTATTAGITSKGNDTTAYTTGIYVQEKYVLDKWIFRAGGRFNYTKNSYDLLGGTTPEVPDKSWNKFLWSAGVRYNLIPQLAFYSNGGSSFLVPSAKSVGGTLNTTDFGVPGKNGQLPNPNLKPESGLSCDLGTDILPIPKMAIGIRGFYTVIDDAIVDNRVSLTPSQTQSVNAGTATSYGVEAEIKHSLNKYIQWFANYTYTHTNIRNSVSPDENGANIPFVPNQVANFGLNLNLPYGFLVSPYLHWVGTYYDSTSKTGRIKFGDYETLNIKLQKVFEIGKSQLKCNLDLNNVTNNKYEMPWQFQNPGFSAFGSIEYNF
ncbi:MAG TPA: TonB-dependent receptor [Thermodesulfobacteriota bacterium]|nr:TonB-dependent receptor [Thermodesulfobacteriota bacterium]